jgi:hypothetical protein
VGGFMGRFPRTAPFAMAAILATWVAAVHPVRAAVVFSTDFESGLPAEFSAPGSELDGVQGYAGLGPAGRQFGGLFLRYTSVPLYPTTLTVRNLPPHDHLSVKFLLGIIDSWDGTELLQIRVDNVLRFNHWFLLATGDTTDYTPAPPGSILSMSTNLGFSGCCYYNRDRAYDLGVDPAFLDIPHTADSVVVEWTISAISGPAADQWQGGDDESWAIDAVSVEVSQSAAVGDAAPSAELALAPLANPSRERALRFRVTVPEGRPAQFALLDLAGRRLSSRRIEGGAVARTIELAPNRRLAPGVYLAQLSQNGTTRSVRVVVTE